MKRLMMAMMWCMAGTACAQMQPAMPRADVLTLEAQAGSEVPQDVATVTLVTEVEMKEPAQLAQRINQTLEDTLKEAKAEPRVSARSGAYRTFPTTDRDGRISAWRGRAEVILESRDFKVLAALAGRLSSRMQVAGMAFSLSPEARQAEEDRLIAQAIARFQKRAELAAKSLGYAGFSVLEIGVGTQGPGSMPPRPYARSMAAAEAVSVPVEGGRANVVVSVSGSVKLEK